MKMRNKQKGFTITELVIVILLLVCLGGWIGNIVHLVDVIKQPLTAFEVLRIVGVPVAPLGVVLGFISN